MSYICKQLLNLYYFVLIIIVVEISTRVKVRKKLINVRAIGCRLPSLLTGSHFDGDDF